MKKDLQDNLKSIMQKADALVEKVSAEKRGPTPEEDKELSGYRDEAKKLAGQIDTLNDLEAVKKYGRQSEGSVVAASFGRETLPGEGEMPGVTMDPRSGEMHAVDGAFKSAGQ